MHEKGTVLVMKGAVPVMKGALFVIEWTVLHNHEGDSTCHEGEQHLS